MAQLCNDRQFQHCLSAIDRLAPHAEPTVDTTVGADVKVNAQQKLTRISRDIQRQVKTSENNQTAFRLASPQLLSLSVVAM